MFPSRPASIARSFTLALVWALAWLTTHTHALTLPAVISDGLVVQRGAPVRVWGTSTPGERIEVRLAGDKASTNAGADGNWLLQLPPMTVAAGELRVASSGGDTRVVRDVVLGQVWLCGGQSNMAMALHRTDGAALAEAPRLGGMVRLYRAAGGAARLAQETWLEDSVDNARQFSALCYMVGRALAQQLNEPVGLIDTSVGATRLEAWRPNPVSSREVPTFDEKRRNLAGFAFQAVVSPLTPMSVKGVIWYQGEADTARYSSDYAARFVQVFGAWRHSFRQPSMPVFIVQLPGNKVAKKPEGWREVQRQQLFASTVLHDAYVLRNDDKSFDELHPREKQVISHRLAVLLLKRLYPVR